MKCIKQIPSVFIVLLGVLCISELACLLATSYIRPYPAGYGPVILPISTIVYSKYEYLFWFRVIIIALVVSFECLFLAHVFGLQAATMSTPWVQILVQFFLVQAFGMPLIATGYVRDGLIGHAVLANTSLVSLWGLMAMWYLSLLMIKKLNRWVVWGCLIVICLLGAIVGIMTLSSVVHYRTNKPKRLEWIGLGEVLTLANIILFLVSVIVIEGIFACACLFQNTKN